MSEKEVRLGFLGNEKTVKVQVPDGSPVPWGLADDLKVMGKDHPRVDALAKVTGRAKYSYDIRFTNLIYARILRSPHAAATITKVDLSKVKALKGVLFTESYEGRAVRYAGAQVAGVAAVSEEILDDALALVKVEYEVQPHVVSTDAAMKPGAPTVTRRPNVIVSRRGRQGNQDAAQRAHKEADVVVEAEYRTQVQTHSCLETHGGVCKWDEEGKKLTVWHSTQSTFGTRRSIARRLGIGESDVTVITQHMGGGFGSKFGADGWDVFCARAAKATGRPCRYMLDRKEEHMIGGNRPDSIQKCKFSAKGDGTLMGGEVHSWGSAGNGHGGAGVYNPAIYNFRGRYSEQAGVSTHAGGGRAFRAPRHPQGLFALECMMDELAEKLGMDPLAFRKQNDTHPVRLAQYDIGAKEIGWKRREKSGSQKGRLRRGLGMAASRWPHTGRPGTVVDCRIGKDGSVLIANGSQDIGTGTRTVMAICGAEELGLKPEEINVRLGNTNDPYGHGSGGSTTTASMAPSVRHAAFNAKRELLANVARKIGGDAEKMDLKDGKVVGAKRALTFKQACGLLQSDVDARGGGEALWRVPRFSREVAGVQFVEVEVDTETGGVRVIKVVIVQDCGRVVNALTARSQMNGGVIQGISYALFENRLLDPNLGDMVNADFLGYKFAGALDTPEIVSIPFDSSQGGSITGVSSLGEPCTVPTAGAIGNAVANAIGVHVRSIPITPDKVLEALGAI